MAQHGVPTILLRLLEEYEWNNMLHMLVERVIIQSVQVDSHSMRKALFIDARLVEFLIRVTERVDSPSEEEEGNLKPPAHLHFRKGYLGHVTKIANFVQRVFENNAAVLEYVDQS